MCAGSAAIYLGCMDVLFNLEHDVYRGPDAAAIAIEAMINVFSLAVGGHLIAFAWRSRRALDPS